jgi:hypothetical protein
MTGFRTVAGFPIRRSSIIGRTIVSPERPSVSPDGVADRRLFIAADAAGYRKQSEFDQAAMRCDLLDLLDGAAAAAGLPRPAWRRRPCGVGELATLSVDGPARPVADSFVRELDAELFRYNLSRRQDARLYLRLSVHYGQFGNWYNLPLGSVVEHQAERVPQARADRADPVPHR